MRVRERSQLWGLGRQFAGYGEGEGGKEAIGCRCEQGRQVLVITGRLNCQRGREAVLTLLRCRSPWELQLSPQRRTHLDGQGRLAADERFKT